MDEVDQFLERYREELLERLTGLAREDRKSSDPATEPDPLKFIETVLEAWSRLPRESRRSRVRSGERTFWYALYTMEDLVESPAAQAIEPWEGVLLKELAEARRLLETRAELPYGRFATRPDGG